MRSWLARWWPRKQVVELQARLEAKEAEVDRLRKLQLQLQTELQKTSWHLISDRNQRRALQHELDQATARIAAWERPDGDLGEGA